MERSSLFSPTISFMKKYIIYIIHAIITVYITQFCKVFEENVQKIAHAPCLLRVVDIVKL